MRIALIIFLLLAIFAYEEIGGGICVCENCMDCSSLIEAIQNEVVECSYIIMNESVQFSGDCIEASIINPISIVFDCNNNWMNFTNSSSSDAIAIAVTEEIPFELEVRNCKINGGRIVIKGGQNITLNNTYMIFSNESSPYGVYISSYRLIINNSEFLIKSCNNAIVINLTQDLKISGTKINGIETATALYIINSNHTLIEKSTIKCENGTAILFEVREMDASDFVLGPVEVFSGKNCVLFKGDLGSVDRSKIACSNLTCSEASLNFTGIKIYLDFVSNRVNARSLFYSFNSTLSLLVYDNIINVTYSVYEGEAPYSVFWNTTKTSGPNIVGGPYRGGNFWVGYSETCTDNDKDGICDDPYVIDENNVDYLPLTYFEAPNETQEVSSFNLTSLASIVSKKSFNNLNLIAFASFSNAFVMKYNNKCFGIYNGKLFWGDYTNGVCYLNKTKSTSYRKGIFIFSCPNGYILFNGIKLEFSMPCNEDNITIACDRCSLGLIGVKIQ